ncbi:MAG: benzoate/H(+) symporter BenE family transporter [Comamonadaceae bacterium]|nr:benzoate/H(+) symporter BenE family transporter [Comamonadaceae bacterium]
MHFFRDLTLSTFTAGIVAVLVAFASSVAVIYQAAQALGATPAQVTSWVWALSIGMGLCTVIPSLMLKKPVMIAWSTPGGAVVATAAMAGGFTMAEGIGAFLMGAVLIVLAGATGWFERVMNRIPMALAAALLAGVLGRFALDAFSAARTAPSLVILMLLAYLLARRLAPRYAVVLTLLVGVAHAALTGHLQWSGVSLELARPVFTMPAFSFSAFMSITLPLFVVTMASQNLPGVAVIRASGYQMPISRLITMTGVATFIFAPFGGYALNLGAITAAICTGPGAHEDLSKRYTAAVVCGVLYLIIGLFAGVITGLLMAFPSELVLAIAGLALLGSIAGGLAQALAHENEREAALITFLVTLSGVAIAGVGSAFWGVVAGSIALFVQQYGRKPRNS